MVKFTNVAMAAGVLAVLTAALYGKVEVVSKTEWDANKARFEAPKREAKSL